MGGGIGERSGAGRTAVKRPPARDAAGNDGRHPPVQGSGPGRRGSGPRPTARGDALELRYHTLDVFTDRVFGGNPLGVFPDAAGLSDGLMQRIAREMNLSETVFLSPPETAEGTRRVRIFTPAVEVPFAGHPTIGAAWFLAANGAVELPPDGGGHVVLEENVGLVRVDVETAGGRPTKARLTAAVPPERRAPGWTDLELARMLSLPGDAVGADPDGLAGVTSRLEPEVVSMGLPFVVVPVRDLESVRRSRLDTAIWEELTRDAWSRMIYVVAPAAEAEGVDLRVRMYAPAAGVPEDPATGSAAAALGAYLGARCRDGGGTFRWRVEQGVEMGRPSLLEVEADVEDGEVRAVRVGGEAVLVSRGTMNVPEGGVP